LRYAVLSGRYETGAQAREIQREHVPVLVGLHGNAIPGTATGMHERMRNARRRLRELVIMDDGSAGNQQAGLLRTGREMRFDKRVEIGIHLVIDRAAAARRARGIQGIIPYR